MYFICPEARWVPNLLGTSAQGADGGSFDTISGCRVKPGMTSLIWRVAPMVKECRPCQARVDELRKETCASLWLRASVVIFTHGNAGRDKIVEAAQTIGRGFPATGLWGQ